MFLKGVFRLKKCIIFLSLIICLFLCSCEAKELWTQSDNFTIISTEESNESGLNLYRVIRVVDGDTIIINKDGAETKVRLIGVDTPESVATGNNAYKNCEEGKIASEFTKGLLDGASVSLEYDVSPQDKYGRDLCYVYLEDGKMLNELLLEKGYARLMTVPPNVKYVDEFTKIQKTSQEMSEGFWSSEESPWVD